MLRRHDLLLARYIAAGHARQPGDILGFAAISEEEVRTLLEPRGAAESRSAEIRSLDERIARIDAEIPARVEASARAGARLPLSELQDRFGLGAIELDVLVACMAVELDRRYERVYGFLHDDMNRRLMSPGLLAALCRNDLETASYVRAAFDGQAPLRYYRLVDLAPDANAPWSARGMRIDERIAAFILGEPSIDARIARHVTAQSFELRARTDDAEQLPAASVRAASVERIAQAAIGMSPDGRLLAYLHGAEHANPDGFVASVARRLEMPVLTVDLERLTDADVDDVLLLAFRESVLIGAAVHLRHFDHALEGPAGVTRSSALMRCIAEMGSVVFASGERAWCWKLPAPPVTLRLVELEADGVEEQLQAWRAAAGDAFDDAELYHLISLHPMPVAAVRDVWRMAQGIVAPNDERDIPGIDHIRQACRAFAGAPASTLARRIEPRHRWADLVLPAPQLEQLSALCSQAKHASIVYGAWQFGRKLSLGRGLSAMFTGQPGTGKTMAAEVIASELGVEMLKIDLSQVVSKYIGETEKNLRELFDQAARANTILFFDEADALLGKRSDVKDSHDRYANTETAYLLQKMEEYPGITILATNLRQNMDQAFTRRLRFILDFPFPEEEDRLRIWRAVWPAEVPLGADVDLELMARQFRLAGGSIRNVALAAAFLAAEQRQSISMRHLMLATKRELQKMGRLVNEEEYRRYG